MLRTSLGRTILSRATQALVQHRTALALRLHTHPNPLMARKSARAIAAAEAHSSSEEHATSNRISLSDLNPKACLTCGRVITPRAKWAKDWAGIKYCSDRCRSTRPGKIVVIFNHDAGDAGDLEACSGVERGEGDELRVDVETFVEGVLLDVAGRRGGGTLEDAQQRMQDLLKEASIPIGQPRQVTARGEGSDHGSDQDDKVEEAASDSTIQAHPLWKALDNPPDSANASDEQHGVSPSPSRTTHPPTRRSTQPPTLAHLLLSHSGKPLRTVQDLSFAKGIIHISLKKS